MKLTTRGWSVIILILFCLWMATAYGARSLNAIVAPLVIILIAATITVSRSERPTIVHRPVPDGHQGDQREVTLDIDINTPTAGSIIDSLEAGMRAETEIGKTTIRPDTSYTYSIHLSNRGEFTIGPPTVRVSDILGLVVEDFEYESQTEVLVYPAVYSLQRATRADMEVLADAVREREREEFDFLREYTHGDPLRDIHWKTSAKRPDNELIVREYVADDNIGSVIIVAEGNPECGDAMASATASMVAFLLNLNVSVGIIVPGGEIDPDTGQDHYTAMLRLLARTPSGSISNSDTSDGDMHIFADQDGVSITVGSVELEFERLIGHNVLGQESISEQTAEAIIHKQQSPGVSV